MHRFGADLDLDRHAVRTEQSGVQRLVPVHPWDGNVILEAPGHRFIDAVHQTKRPIAGVGVVDDDAKSVHIDHFVDGDALVLHLLVDAVQVLLAPLHAAGDPGLLQRALEGLGDFADEFLLIAARTLQFALQHFVTVGIQRAEPQILELELDRVQTQALRDRRVDIQGLACAAAALDRRHHTERAHVMHPVGELHHDHADVAHHRQQHLAKALRLSLLAILELNLIQLADAVDEFGDHLTEDRRDLGLGGGGVLDHVVQNRGHQRVGVQMQIREDVGDRYGVA